MEKYSTEQANLFSRARGRSVISGLFHTRYLHYTAAVKLVVAKERVHQRKVAVKGTPEEGSCKTRK